jgi:hypothetical protein
MLEHPLAFRDQWVGVRTSGHDLSEFTVNTATFLTMESMTYPR